MNMEKMLVGLSLSMCVRDMLDGKVKPENVAVIYAGTMASTDNQWNKLMVQYSQTFWKKDPAKAQGIAGYFRRAGLLIQPRTIGREAPNVSQGYWAGLDQMRF